MASSSNSDFVRSTINEIINIWTRGAGKASFNIDVCHGTAEVKMSFFLDHPTKNDVASFTKPKVDNIKGEAIRKHKKRKRKSPSTKRRDQKRADEFYRKKISSVVLPFLGQLIPLNEAAEDLPAVYNASFEAVTPDPNIPPEAQAPAKQLLKKRYVDVNSVKKQLFDVPAVEIVREKVKSGRPPGKLSKVYAYQQKEEDLMSRLFS